MPRPSRFTSRKETWFPLYRKLGGPQGQYGWVQKISPPTGIQSLGRPARSESLYRLSYPGPHSHRIRILPKKLEMNILAWSNIYEQEQHTSYDNIKTLIEMYPVKNNGQINTLQQGCTNPRCQVTMANKFCMVACNIRVSSQWKSLHVPLLVPRILRLLLGN